MDPDSTSNINGSAETAVLFSLDPSEVEKSMGCVIFTSDGFNANGTSSPAASATLTRGASALLAASKSSINCSRDRTTGAAAAAGASGFSAILLDGGRPRELLLDDIIEILFPFAQRKRVGNHRLVKF